MDALPEYIELTTDAELKAKLRRKLREYILRYGSRSEEANKARPPYKLKLLWELLSRERVHVMTLKLELHKEYGRHDSIRYGHAVRIIAAYNAGDAHLRIDGEESG